MDYKARVSTLRKVGDRICSKERDDYETFSGQYIYSVDEVKEMLNRGALGEDPNSASPWVMSVEEIEALGRPDSEITNTRIDLYLALKALGESNARHAYLILLRYREGYSFEHSDPDRKACERAVESLAREMNRINIRRSAKFDGPRTDA